MKPTLLKKSWGDLGKRRSRTIFTILTIALGVAALGMFAVIPLFDQAMFDEIDEANMWNVRTYMQNVEMDEEDIIALESIENIENVEPKQHFSTRIYIGERRSDALFVGIQDLDNIKVDKITLDAGEYPGSMEVLTDTGNSRYDLFNAEVGDSVRVIGGNGENVDLFISGQGRTLTYFEPTYGIAVFFVDMETIRTLSNVSGYNSLSIDLDTTSEEDLTGGIEDVRSYLEQNTDFVAFTEIPETRSNDEWPGMDNFRDMANFFYVLTFMTMFCSVFLISNTMHTIITEQKKEIAQMKAVGATKSQVGKSYITTSFIMGALGSIIGSFLGIWVAFGMVWFLGTSFYGIVPSFDIYWPGVLISATIGIAITILATIPSLWGALRTNTREGLQDAGISVNYGGSFIDKVLLRSKFLPRPSQMGLRNAARKKGRSISTILQVALAVSMFLGVVTIGHSLAERVEQEYDNFTFDIMVNGQMDGGKTLSESVAHNIEMIEGVEVAEPFMMTQVSSGDSVAIVLGYNYDTVAYAHHRTLYQGRWFTEQEQIEAKNVIVIGRALAKVENIQLGDIVDIETATGVQTFEVIGLDSGQMMNGEVGYVPLNTIQNILRTEDMVSGFSVVTTSGDHELIDRVSTEIEDDLTRRGFVVENDVWYVMKENNIRSNQQVINLMIAVGTIIVLITMIGLMSTLTMNILERTREIGMMRCIGSRSSHIRRTFATEGVAMALLGGLVGIPLGYGVGTFLNVIMLEILNLEMDLLFPMNFVIIVLVVTIVLTLVVIQPPLFRATHFKPGDALRYQ